VLHSDANIKTHVRGKQALEFFTPSSLQSSGFQNFTACSLIWCPFSLTYTIASYGFCYFFCSCNIRVKEEKKVVAIQEHKKPTSKRNPRNQGQEKSITFNIK
jgi:hypothetical protein